MSTDRHHLITAAQEMVKEPRERDRRPRFKCPACGWWYSDVVRGEPVILSPDGGYVRRHRCLSCDARFETEENLRATADTPHVADRTA